MKLGCSLSSTQKILKSIKKAVLLYMQFNLFPAQSSQYISYICPHYVQEKPRTNDSVYERSPRNIKTVLGFDQNYHRL